MNKKDSSITRGTDSKRRSKLSRTEMEPLWTVKEVAHYLRLKPETVRAMARRGDLPVVKVGRMWRFRRNLIEAWLHQASDDSVEAGY